MHNTRMNHLLVNHYKYDYVWLTKTMGNTEKSNMRMGSNFDPLVNEIFKCRTLDISTTNS